MLQRKAFSLMEMLVVISLITLLISLLMPSLTGAREEARASKCSSNTRQWATAFQSFTVDHNSVLPAFADQYPGLKTETLWYNVVAPYINLETVSANDPQKSAKNSRNWHAEIRRCPSGSAFVGVHYGAWNNSKPARAPINYQTYANPDPPVNYPDLKLEAIRNPSGWAMLFDTASHFMYSPNGWLRTEDTDNDSIPDTHNALAATTTYIYNGARPREHINTTNIAFVDTHVERVAFSEWLNEGGFWTDD